ncbi:unnamed protein product [Prorocentrum cordatum]|uniref:Uncharacterized protein n=1 Tax=Prorocentrum cordatum TaxID=2364126 RepID=A0ABN9PAB2_9DINO|nr:unnamed protein product [Polarella glacialis]
MCEKDEQWLRSLALLSEMWEAKLELDVISSLQCWDPRVPKGRALAAGSGAAERSVRGEAGSECSQLRPCDRRSDAKRRYDKLNSFNARGALRSLEKGCWDHHAVRHGLSE